MRAFKYTLLFALVLAGLTARGQTPVPPSSKRVASLELARTLLTTTPPKVDADVISRKNPFGARLPAQSIEPEKPAPVTISVANDRDVLVNTIGGITPSGTMMLGDSPILLFGQKKLKVGDFLPIVFQGKSYELELIAIERTSFTLRLNKEEITRPIKPANKP